TALLVLSQESNAKSCASLVLRVQKEASQWTLNRRKSAGGAFHTPGCLLDGSACAAEIVRSLKRSKKLHFIDRANPRERDCEETRFRVNSDRYITEKTPDEAMCFPLEGNRRKEMQEQEERQEERMKKPG